LDILGTSHDPMAAVGKRGMHVAGAALHEHRRARRQVEQLGAAAPPA